jgi:hypothetical protein
LRRQIAGRGIERFERRKLLAKPFGPDLIEPLRL